MTVNSNAKINLFLDITGKDPSDGYHHLDSLFQEINLADEIILERIPAGGEDKIIFEGADISGDTTVHKALRMFKSVFGVRTAVSVVVKKKIPIGAGLGGGSSNAAFLLTALAREFNVPEKDVLDIGRAVGSDVPFFFKGGLCRVRGKGEIVESLQNRLKNITFLLLYPKIPVSTKWAYSLITDYTQRRRIDGFLNKMEIDIDLLKQIIYNKFEHFVIGSSPELGKAKAILDNKLMADCSFMSGSGSTLVYAYGDRSKAEEDIKVVSDKQQWDAYLCDPLYR